MVHGVNTYARPSDDGGPRCGWRSRCPNRTTGAAPLGDRTLEGWGLTLVGIGTRILSIPASDNLEAVAFFAPSRRSRHRAPDPVI